MTIVHPQGSQVFWEHADLLVNLVGGSSWFGQGRRRDAKAGTLKVYVHIPRTDTQDLHHRDRRQEFPRNLCFSPTVKELAMRDFHKSSWEMHIIKLYAWLSNVFCTKNKLDIAYLKRIRDKRTLKEVSVRATSILAKVEAKANTKRVVFSG